VSAASCSVWPTCQDGGERLEEARSAPSAIADNSWPRTADGTMRSCVPNLRRYAVPTSISA
jgi:hypothetical protein